METTVLARLGAHLAAMKLSDLPADVVDRAATCVADALACAFVGAQEPAAARARELVSLTGPATLWATTYGASPADAALANAVSSHAIIQDDFLRGAGHPGSIVVPAAIAVAQTRHATGAELLTAVVAGYETMGRIGRAFAQVAQFRDRSFRTSGYFGPFGAAAAAGALLDLDADQMAGALGMAGNFAVGLREWAYAGTPDIYFHNGIAAHSGVLAAQLAKRGVWGPVSLLEGRAGFNQAYADGSAPVEEISQRLGDEYAIRNVTFKPAPACQTVQTVLQVAHTIHREHRGTDFENLRQCTVFTVGHGKVTPGNDFPGPFISQQQAQMSNQFAVAVSLLYGRAGLEEYRRFSDPRVERLAHLIEVNVDPHIDAAYPPKLGARIEIVLDDDSRVAASQEDLVYPRPEDTYDKLERAASATLGKRQAHVLLDQVSHLAAAPTLKTLFHLLSVPA